VIKKSKTTPENAPQVVTTKEYAQFLVEIKKEVESAQVKAILSANTELIKLYWFIGKALVEKQQKYGWGNKIIEKLSQDLQNELPGLGGFSRPNIFRMQAFYRAYEIVSQAVRQLEELPFFHIPWGQNILLITQVKNETQRLWYAQQTIDNGWSRSALESWIKSDLYSHQGKAISNFRTSLPEPHSALAQQSFKDPYIFDFLTLHKEHLEQELEQGLIDNVEKLLLEMGKGFALVGRQYHLHVGEKDFYLDLLFYHVKMQCYVVVELKTGEFIPEHAGKLNFYLSAVDDLVRNPTDKPTIGLLLCKTKDNFIAEYALRDINKPMGVAGYETEILNKLPKELKGTLPTIEEIEAEFEKNEILRNN
jgi:Uncharacterized conserved protein